MLFPGIFLFYLFVYVVVFQYHLTSSSNSCPFLYLQLSVFLYVSLSFKSVSPSFCFMKILSFFFSYSTLLSLFSNVLTFVWGSPDTLCRWPGRPWCAWPGSRTRWSFPPRRSRNKHNKKTAKNVPKICDIFSLETEILTSAASSIHWSFQLLSSKIPQHEKSIKYQ